ncbi:MAG: type II toxin-antitoxin system prevent-host-death family antitoxin [Actinobacteria bacterium]|jgi:prevent-host-death family protein|nr:type II toxin-antitoxin system prevent-host-death family antitoxin [Actinomycetota bacterium]
MKTVNIHEAKTHLSRLIQEAVDGEEFVIAKAGRPMVKVTAIAEAAPPVRRLGSMRGQIIVPADFDTMDQDEIIALFEGGE